jgi:hypothetical protein
MGHGVQADAMIQVARDSEPPVSSTDRGNDAQAAKRNSGSAPSRTVPNIHTGSTTAETNQLGDRLLVFDCHEAWVYQLRLLGLPMDVVVGLRGRQKSHWDEAMRPLPPRARVVRQDNVLPAAEEYRCIVAHNLTDLLDVKSLSGPRLLVLHETLDGALLEQRATVPASELRRAVRKFTKITNTHVVAVSKLKGKSWGFLDDIVTLSASTEDYPAWRGDVARGLRVANHILRRPRILMWEFHERAFGNLPVTLVGHNPEMNGVKAASNWMDLKDILSHHRFYIHTADPQFEDGYNMATLEAMAAGLPVLGNRHPTSPVIDGVSGYLSDDPAELRNRAIRLLADRELAARMGAAARATVQTHFPPSRFAEGFGRSIVAARNKWNTRQSPSIRKRR